MSGKTAVSEELKDFLDKKSGYIGGKWEYFKSLSRSFAAGKRGRYITHSDTPGNLMVDKSGKLFIVDWDDVLMAPIERIYGFS